MEVRVDGPRRYQPATMSALPVAARRRSFRRARPRPQDASPVRRGVRLSHHGARRRAGADRAFGGQQADRPARGRPRRRAAGPRAARRRADAGGARPSRARARRRLQRSTGSTPTRRRSPPACVTVPRSPARDAGGDRRRPARRHRRVHARAGATKESASTSRSANRAISSAMSTTATHRSASAATTPTLRGLARRLYRRDRLVLAVYAGHALAGRASVRFAETLAFDHVGLPPSTAVHALLQREAARLDRAVPVPHRGVDLRRRPARRRRQPRRRRRSGRDRPAQRRRRRPPADPDRRRLGRARLRALLSLARRAAAGEPQAGRSPRRAAWRALATPGERNSPGAGAARAIAGAGPRQRRSRRMADRSDSRSAPSGRAEPTIEMHPQGSRSTSSTRRPESRCRRSDQPRRAAPGGHRDCIAKGLAQHEQRRPRP